MSQENIADASRPNAGRMYDYYLGGSHNFDVDRQAAEQIMGMMPYISKYARLQRWALQDIAEELSKKLGYEVIVDFASGLPTEDHIHYHVPEDTTVIYSDYDPITVEYAHDILGNTPNVYYFEADATRPEDLLNNPKIQHLLTGKKVAFVLWGVTGVLSDEKIKHLTQCLYDNSNADSCLVINAQTSNPDSPIVQQVMEVYRKLGTKSYSRRVEAFEDLVKPWNLDSRGWIPLLEWHGFDKSELAQEDVEAFGPLGGGHGAYLVK
jgi:hypothetical protein